MSKFLKLSVTALAAVSMWACVDNANMNKPANMNANANASNSNANAITSKVAPTVDALMALDKQANDAYSKGDGQFFQGFLSDKFAMSDKGMKQGKADAVKMISGVKCDIKSMSLDNPKLSMIDADNYALVYKNNTDGTCTYQGRSEKIPTPLTVATVWTRSGDKWEAVWHGETPIIDPKNAPKPAPPAKSDNMAANSNSGSNSNSNSSTAPASDPNIDAMIAVEKSGWEAWKARDAAKLDSITTANVSFVGLFGNYDATKADVIKDWTGGTCDIKSTSVTDTSGQSISPTLGFIMFKGSGDGTCENMKVSPVWGTSFYVKDGDSWKLAFGFETPA
jgi:hypothetical protein